MLAALAAALVALGPELPLVHLRLCRAQNLAALRWMRKNGWPEAEKTRGGSDSGIDVRAEGAVAQVKWYSSQKVGGPDLQRLRGRRE